MISAELAVALRDAGVRWRPAAGDRFVIPQPELDGEIFTLSEMTIEAREYSTGTVLGFNGTTEWALDSVAQDEALWLPREDQLRELLGGTFVSLAQVSAADDQDDAGSVESARDGAVGEEPLTERGHRDEEPGPALLFEVTTRGSRGTVEVHAAPSAADAYALALLALVERATTDA
ncbi:pilus assembly protein CpaE [Actinotalea sp. C106]|uniref:pilus assembly protein CpaE n=1 Tax=Actinotalea sp. C106 TaxID=2908644 RepID=UPI0035AB79DF